LSQDPQGSSPTALSCGEREPGGFCRKIRFLGQNPKVECQEFNDLQTHKLSKKQLCDRTHLRYAQFWSSGRRSDPPLDSNGTRPDGVSSSKSHSRRFRLHHGGVSRLDATRCHSLKKSQAQVATKTKMRISAASTDPRMKAASNTPMVTDSTRKAARAAFTRDTVGARSERSGSLFNGDFLIVNRYRTTLPLPHWPLVSAIPAAHQHWPVC
jgi:hypothetical protein